MQKKGGIEQNVLDKEVRKDTTVAYGHTRAWKLTYRSVSRDVVSYDKENSCPLTSAMINSGTHVYLL